MKNIIETAMLAYIDAGISVIPIHHKTKQPAWWLLPQATNDAGQLLFNKQMTRADGTTFTIATTEDTGKPKHSWKPYQQRIATHDEVCDWCKSGIKSLSVVGGDVSGGLEIMDFDVYHGQTWPAILSLLTICRCNRRAAAGFKWHGVALLLVAIRSWLGYRHPKRTGGAR